MKWLVAHRVFVLAFVSLGTLFLLGYILTTHIRYQNVDTPTPTASAVYKDVSQPIEVRVADLLSYMTFEEKIGQMALVEKNSIFDIEDIADYHLGALLSGAGAKPEINTPEGWRDMIAGYQRVASTSRLGIPLLYGADAVHGHAHVPLATVFPHAIGLGAANDPKLVQAVAQATAQEMYATGVNWSFSPNLDQPLDIRWGRVYEAFSDDPEIVSRLGVAYIEGLQEHDDDGSLGIHILATPKHFLGLGSMEWGTSQNKNYTIDQGVTPADETLLREAYLPPFAEAIEAGALSIMVGLNTWGDERLIVQKELLTDIVKGELGFKGFLVSDWYGVHEGRTNKFWATIEAVNAGVDMLMLPYDYKEFVWHMTWAHRLGLISEERIDDAVGRILYAKFALGLFDKEKSSTDTIEILSASHKDLARRAAAQSLVLLKNENNLVPLSPTISHIRVAGSAANNVGRQMGAWTIEWQGVDGESDAQATSILEAIRERVSDSTNIEFSRTGDFVTPDKKVPLGIAIVGEKPYAEGWGDTPFPILSNEDLLAIKKLQVSAEQVIVIIISGRPLLITEEVDSFDALIAAWLPGGEGAGVVDGLFGDTPLRGTLPLPWPRYAEQLPLQHNGATKNNTDVLFPRGFGLTTP